MYIMFKTQTENAIMKEEIYYIILFFFLLFFAIWKWQYWMISHIYYPNLSAFNVPYMAYICLHDAAMIYFFSYLRYKSRTIQKCLSFFFPLCMFQLIQVLLMIVIMRTWIFRVFITNASQLIEEKIEEIKATLRIWIWFVNFCFWILIWKKINLWLVMIGEFD